MGQVQTYPSDGEASTLHALCSALFNIKLPPCIALNYIALESIYTTTTYFDIVDPNDYPRYTDLHNAIIQKFIELESFNAAHEMANRLAENSESALDSESALEEPEPYIQFTQENLPFFVPEIRVRITQATRNRWCKNGFLLANAPKSIQPGSILHITANVYSVSLGKNKSNGNFTVTFNATEIFYKEPASKELNLFDKLYRSISKELA